MPPPRPPEGARSAGDLAHFFSLRSTEQRCEHSEGAVRFDFTAGYKFNLDQNIRMVTSVATVWNFTANDFIIYQSSDYTDIFLTLSLGKKVKF